MNKKIFRFLLPLSINLENIVTRVVWKLNGKFSRSSIHIEDEQRRLTMLSDQLFKKETNSHDCVCVVGDISFFFGTMIYFV